MLTTALFTIRETTIGMELVVRAYSQHHLLTKLAQIYPGAEWRIDNASFEVTSRDRPENVMDVTKF